MTTYEKFCIKFCSVCISIPHVQNRKSNVMLKKENEIFFFCSCFLSLSLFRLRLFYLYLVVFFLSIIVGYTWAIWIVDLDGLLLSYSAFELVQGTISEKKLICGTHTHKQRDTRMNKKNSTKTQTNYSYWNRKRINMQKQQRHSKDNSKSNKKKINTESKD